MKKSKPKTKASAKPATKVSANERHKRFAAEYLKDLNAKQAAIRAGYSANTAESQGSRLLMNVKVRKLVEAGNDKRLEKLEINAERVLAELAKLAFFDPRKLYNADGSLKALTELDDNTAAAVAGFDIEELFEHFGKGAAKEIGKVKKIKFADKGQNLERLGKHLKLFTDKVEVSGKLDTVSDAELDARIAVLLNKQ